MSAKMEEKCNGVANWVSQENGSKLYCCILPQYTEPYVLQVQSSRKDIHGGQFYTLFLYNMQLDLLQKWPTV